MNFLLKACLVETFMFVQVRIGLRRFFVLFGNTLKGEHSIGFLANMFAKLDHESEYNLSKRKTKKDRQRWCVDEAMLIHT